MNGIKNLFVFTVIVIVLTALTGCGVPESSETPSQKSGAQPSPPAAKEVSIAVIPKGTTHEFWKSVHAGAAKAAQELGVSIVWKGPLREDNRDAQISVVEDFISKGVSGIVLAPLDDAALRVPVHAAVAAGIPVVIFDSGLQSDEYVSFVATDNFKAGEIAGTHMTQLLGGSGKVAVLRYQEGSESTANREEGFLKALGGSPAIEVVSANQYAGPTTETAYQAAENLLARFRNPDGTFSLNGIFCPNESSTFGMLRALQDAKLAGSVKFVGFDSSEKMVEAIRAGELNATVVQNPMNMGYMAVKNMVAHLNGEEVTKRVDTGATLVTRENLDTPEVQQLVAPDLKQWLNE